MQDLNCKKGCGCKAGRAVASSGTASGRHSGSRQAKRRRGAEDGSSADGVDDELVDGAAR